MRAGAAPGSDENLMAGWGWLALLRMGLAVSMAAYALTYRALPHHPAPASLRVEAVSIALALAALAFLQLTPRFRASRSAAVIAFLIDAVAVLGIISLYDFDPRRYLLSLVVVVQAEGGMVLGIRGGVWAWGLTSAAYTLVEGLSGLVSGQPIRLAEASLRIGVGLMLAVGGGLLSAELSGERARRMAERRRELRRAQDAETRYRSLVEQIPVVTYVRAAGDAGALYVSPRIEAVLGYAPKEWTANPALWLERVHSEDRDKVTEAWKQADATGDSFRCEYRMTAKQGHMVWIRDEASLLREPEPEPRLWQGVLVDVTDRKQAEQQIAFLAYHDKLTGLPNRAMFEETLDLALARARRNGLAVAVLFLDLDNFKLVNDSIGHAAGDELLKEMAARLRRAVRDTDVVARQGGDEFLVLLADLEKAAGDSASGQPAGSEMAITVASRIHASLQKPFVLLGSEFYVSVSVGISLFPASARDAPGLMQQADSAMYRTKRIGPGGWAVYAADHADASKKLATTTRLRRAVQNGDWELHYQPMVELSNGGIMAVEALVRWRRSKNVLIPPDGFLSLAEEMGLMGPIADWVLEHLCAQARIWKERGAELDVSFNISPRQLWQPGAVGKIIARIRGAGVEPSRVLVELTESTAMADPERTHRVLQEMHDRGLRLAIDDFGTGYSSLARLRDLPVDLLKIDRRFVADLPEDPGAMSMVRAVIGLAQTLGMKALAEGVETEAQRAFLLENGCELGQGYLFSPPVPAAEIEGMVDHAA